MRRTNRSAVSTLLLIAALVTASCGGGDSSPYRKLSGLDATPDETLEDWVSYSDVVVVVQITSEDGESALTPDELASGEGLTVRYVTAEVGEVVWSREGLTADEVPRSISIDAPGWLYSDGHKTPYVMDDGIRLELGESYLMPIAEFDSGGWRPIGFGTALNGARVSDLGTGHDEVPVDGETRAATALSGMSLEAAAERLASTAPDPIAGANADLDPAGRFRAVTAAQVEARGELPPAPGEK